MMTHRIPFPIRLALGLLLAIGAASAGAQQLALTPGLEQDYAGQYQSKSSTSSAASYAGPVNGSSNGLVFNWPQQLTFDKNGNLFIADWRAYVVRVVASGKGPNNGAIPSLPGVTPQAGWVYTVVGNGSGSSPNSSCTTATGKLDSVGDGCPATQAAMQVVGGVAVDANGNLFVPDWYNGTLRVVYSGTGSIPGLPSNAQAGYIYNLAAQPGNYGYSGDGGPATSANVATLSPYQAAVDSNENIYLVDQGANTVRVIYSGTGTVPGLSSPTKGNIYTIAGNPNSTCDGKPADCGNGESAVTSALFNSPQSIAFDPSGNLYIADTGSGMIGAIYFGSGTLPGISSPVTGNYYIVAGGGSNPTPDRVAATSAALSLVSQVSFDAAGSIYLAANLQAFRVDSSGTIYTIFGDTTGVNCASATNADGDGCPATGVALINIPAGVPSNATGVAVDTSGNIYVSDQNGGTHGKGLIRESLVSSTTPPLTLSLAHQMGAAPAIQTVDVYNTGASALTLSGLNSSGAGFSIAATGGEMDCTSTTQLAPGATCQIGIAFEPSQPGSNYSGSVSVQSGASEDTIALTGTATAQPTVTTFQLTPFQVGSGEPVTFTATISGPAGTTLTPTGTVNFVTTGSSPVTLATAPLTNGVATATQAVNLSAGTYAVTAQYSGDTNSLASNYTGSLPLTVFSSQTPTPVITVISSVTSSPASITQGTSVTLTATVAPYPSGSTTPTGNVTFQIGGVLLSGTVPLNAGTATFTTSALPVGSNTPTVYYGGDGNYAPAYGTGSAIQVQAASAAQFVFNPGISTQFTLSGGPGGGSGNPDTASGQVALDSNGNLYYYTSNTVYAAWFGKGSLPGIASPVANTIYQVAGGGTGGTCGTAINVPATQVCFKSVQSLKLDTADNLYVLDSNSATSAVWKVSAGSTGGVATIVAGKSGTTGTPSYGSAATQTTLNQPTAIAVDNAGNLYIADNITTHCCPQLTTTIDRVDALTGAITLLAGTPNTTGYTGDGGPALGATLSNPFGLAIDPNGNLDIADQSNNAIRQVNAQTGVITTIAGNPALCPNNLNGRYSNASGTIGDGGAATQACLSNPGGLFVDHFGNLFIAESLQYAASDVREVYPSGTIVTAVNSSELTKGVPGVAEDAQGNLYGANGNLMEFPRNADSIVFNGNTTGSASTVTTSVLNDGNAPLTLSALSFPSGFPQQPSGGTDCAAGTTVDADSAGCEIGIGFFPADSGNASGTATIASNAGNAGSNGNTIALSATNLSNGQGSNQINWTQVLGNVIYGVQPITLTATSSAGTSYTVTYSASGPATISTPANGGNPILTITGAGQVSVTAYQFGDANYATAKAVTQTFTVAQAPLQVTAGSFSCQYGAVASCLAANPLSYTITGFVNGDKQATAVSGTPSLSTTATATSNAGNYPVTVGLRELQLHSH